MSAFEVAALAGLVIVVMAFLLGSELARLARENHLLRSEIEDMNEYIRKHIKD